MMMNCCRSSLLLLLLLLLSTTFLLSIAEASSSSSSSDNTDTDNNDNDDNDDEDVLSLELMDWLKGEGGIINDKVELKLFQPDGVPYQIRGFFTSEDISEGELIIKTPWELIVKPDQTSRKLRKDECSTMANIYLDMKHDRTPYGTYLKHQPRNYVPKFWSDQGQKLLSKLFGKNLIDEWKRSKRNDYWKKHCMGREPYGVDMDDELLLHAAMMVRARADDLLMIPVYDMVNHRNGHWYNAAHKIQENKSYQLIAKRPIKSGEQIYLSYNQCNICHGRVDWHSTPDMFVEYGFVENYPQRYFFEDQRMKFDIIEKDMNDDEAGSANSDDEKENENGETKTTETEPAKTKPATTTTTKLVVDFKTPPSPEGIDFIEEELERLQQFEIKHKSKKEENYTDIPNNEWDKIWELHTAYIQAFTMAIETSKTMKLTNEVWDMDELWYEEDDDDDDEDDDEDEDDEPDDEEQEL